MKKTSSTTPATKTLAYKAESATAQAVQTRNYYFPEHNFGTEAQSLDEAHKQLEAHLSNIEKESK